MDWNRPVYFAVTTGGDAYMGLEQYFQLEGLAYRLTPIKHKKNPNPNIDGGVSSALMYDNMMNKFQWGNMDKLPIYMDENNRRMTTNLRLQFGHLAEQLIEEGDLEKAREVIQRSLDVMPEYNVPYEQPQIMWQLVDLMYEADYDEKALELSKRMIEINNQEIDFYHSLDEKHQKLIEKDITMRVQINDRLSTLGVTNAPDNAEFKAIDEVVKTQLEEFQLPSYQEYLEQEKKMEEMKRKQDSLIKANNATRTTSVSLEGPNGIVKK
jgi:tetratricopeptide (TPR) repeat protein